MLATLSAIGDRHEVAQPILEQVEAVTAYGDNTSGETATRTLLREFRWSVDNATWSAWTTTTTPNLSALVLDPNDPLYLQFAWERTGSDASSVITVHGYSFSVDIDEMATIGRGRFTNTGIYDEVRELIPSVIEGFLTVNGAGDTVFEVLNCHPLTLSNSPNKPLVYVYDFRASGETEDSLCTNSMEIVFRVGVKRNMAPKPGNYTQLGWTTSLFRHGTWEKNTFDCTFKGVEFPSARLTDFGITKCSVFSIAENYAGGNPNYPYDEFSVRMKIEFKNLNRFFIN